MKNLIEVIDLMIEEEEAILLEEIKNVVLIEGAVDQLCIKLFVTLANKIVRCHLNQVVINQYFVILVFPNKVVVLPDHIDLTVIEEKAKDLVLKIEVVASQIKILKKS